MEYQTNYISFDQVCRICMKTSSDLQSIFGHPQDIPDLIRLLSNVEVLEDDELPKLICDECLTFAGNAMEFKERCIQSDRTLREYISDKGEDQKLYLMKVEPGLPVVGENADGLPVGPEFIKCEIDESSSDEKPDDDRDDNDFEIADGVDSDEDEDEDDREEEEEVKLDRRIRRRRTRNTVVEDSDDEPLIVKRKKGEELNCTKCNEKFRNKAHVKFHMQSDHADEKTSKEDRIRQCFYCPKAYSNYEYLKIHLNFHPRNEWTCPMCSKEMKNKGKFIDHLRMHANERHYRCDICEKDFTSHKYISNHMKMHKRKGERSSKYNYEESSSESDCELVDDDKEEDEEEEMNLSDKEEAIKNDYQLNPDAPKDCPVCNETFEKIIYVKYHLQSEHLPVDESAPRVHFCVTCKKSYMTFSHLISHMKLHEEKVWSCPECKKQFRRLDKYKEHQKTHQSDRTFLCVYCGKDFPTTKYMNRHLQTHMKEKVQKPEEEFECEVCGKKMKYKSNYTNHMKTHGPEHAKPIKVDPDSPPKKIYLCSICGRNCGSSSNLTVHMRRHNGQAICACSVCGKGYPRKADLVMHMRRHTGEKPYECPTCGRGFARRDKLRIHIRTHTGEKPYACPCGRAYAQKNDLKTHQKRNTCGQNFDITKLMAPYQTSICVRGPPSPQPPPPPREPPPVPCAPMLNPSSIQSFNSTTTTTNATPVYPTVAQPLPSGTTVGTPGMPSIPPSPSHHDMSRLSDSVPNSPVDLMTHRHPFVPFPGGGGDVVNMMPNYPNHYQQPKVDIDMCNQ